MTALAVPEYGTCTFSLTSTGQAVSTDPALHPQDANAYLTSDVYRLSVSATGAGWSAGLRDALATARFGETIQVPVYVTRAAGSAADGTVTLTATSAGDPSKTASAVCGEANGTVGATLSLSTGAPASFGPFLPGQGRVNGAFAAVSGSPLQLLSCAGPVSNDAVTVGFKQVIGVDDPLRTGTYGKALTFTLSTTNP